jgi:hypothetical protein
VAHAYHTAALSRPVASRHTQSCTRVARLKFENIQEFRILGFLGSDSPPERRRLAQRVPADRATPCPVAWDTRIIPLHSPGLLHHAIRTVARLKLRKIQEFRIFGFQVSDSAPERRRLAQQVPTDRATLCPVVWHTRITPLHSPAVASRHTQSYALVWRG